MGGVVVGGVVGLEQAGEAPVQLDLGVVGVAALGARRVVPALDPQQDRGQQVALELGAVRVGRPRGSAASASIAASSRACSPRGTTTVRPPRPASSQPGCAARPGSASSSSPKRTTAPSSASPSSNTCTWPRPISVTVPGRTGTRRAVDRVLPAAVADPDQLVVVVAVRLAGALAAEAPCSEPDDLGGAAVEPVEREPAICTASAAAGDASGRSPRTGTPCSPPARRQPRRERDRVDHPGAAGRQRHERAVVCQAEPTPSRALAEAAPGLDRLEADVVVVDRQHAAEQDPRAPEPPSPYSPSPVIRTSSHSSALTPSIVVARAHTASGPASTTEETRKDRIVA